MAPNIVDLVERLQRQLVDLGDGRDARSDNERAHYSATYATIQRTITGLRDGPYTTKATAQLAAINASLAAIDAKEREIEAQLAEPPPPFATSQDRDRELARQQHLTLQLRALRDGRLLIEPGVTAERREDLEARREELRRKIARAEAAFESHVKAAEQLLGVEVTS